MEKNPPAARPEVLQSPAAGADPIDGLLERKIRHARWAGFAERFWPRVWLPAGVVGAFVTLSLLGGWHVLTSTQHFVLLGIFCFILLVSLIPLIWTPWPSRDDALRRIERSTGLPHRPALSYQDRLPAGESDPATLTVWAAHRQRMRSLLTQMRVGPFRPRSDLVDPFALRALMLLAVGLLLLVTGERTWDRLAAPFRLDLAGVSQTARVDAWITPPVYTGKPPVLLIDGSKPPTNLSGHGPLFQVPQGSLVVIRASGDGYKRFAVSVKSANGDRRAVEPKAQTMPIAQQPAENARGPAAAAMTVDAGQPDNQMADFTLKLTADAGVDVKNGLQTVASWQFTVIADLPPKIAVTAGPEGTARGALRFSYKAEDDYGVASAQARFARIDGDAVAELAAPPPWENRDGQSDADATKSGAHPRARTPLERPPRVDLKLPRADPKSFEAKAVHDLSAHPWAGLKVKFWLEARDHLNQVGKSAEIEMVLPERRFEKPFARAIIEQRRVLAVDARLRTKVAEALDLLTLAPEHFIEDRTIYLGLRTAYWRLRNDGTRASVRSVIEQLWQIALRIEDGNLSDAERQLRNAQEQLSKALQDGASQDEIKQLMQELRQALANFLQALSKQAERGDQPNGQGPDRTISSRDLDQMLRNIEQMARSGANDSAQQMLAELRDLLEQLQSGRSAQNGQSGQGNQMMQSLDKFGEMIQKQQGLLDETFEQQRQLDGGGDGREGQQGGRPQPGQKGQRGKGGQQQGGSGGESLRDRQNALRGELDRLMQGLDQLGLQAPDTFGQAGDAMENAERALAEKDLERATEQQAQALEQLRQGAQALAEQMMKGMAGRFGRNAGNDPLGRPNSTNGPDPGLMVKVPDKIEAERAREILEELRKRLSDPKRPMPELDYIERLLKRF